jgi:Rieske Fe-S protein
MSDSHTLHRRHLLVAATATCTSLCLGSGCGAHLPGATSDAGQTPDEEPTRDAGRADDAGAHDAGRVDAGTPCVGSLVGLATSFLPGTPVFVNELFMVRDARGLYAVSALCTHQGCVVNHVGDLFECPCHDARYTLEGERISGPARFPLEHFRVCVDAQGKAFVDRSVTVDPATRV